MPENMLTEGWSAGVLKMGRGWGTDPMVEVKPMVVEVHAGTLQVRLTEPLVRWTSVPHLVPTSKEWIAFCLRDQQKRGAKAAG